MSKRQNLDSVLEVHGIWIDVDVEKSNGETIPTKRVLSGIAFPRYDENGQRIANEWSLQGFCLVKHVNEKGRPFFEVRRNPRNGFFEKEAIRYNFDERYVVEKPVKQQDAPRDYLVYFPGNEDVNAPQGHVCSMTLAAQNPQNIVIEPGAESELIINNFGPADRLVFKDFDHVAELSLHALPIKRPNIFGKKRSKIKLPNSQVVVVNGVSANELERQVKSYDDFLQEKEEQEDLRPQEGVVDRIKKIPATIKEFATSKYAAATAYLTSAAAAAATVTQDSFGRKTYKFAKDLNSTTIIEAATAVDSESLIIIDGQVFEGNAIPRRGIANVWSLNGYDLTRVGSKLVITKSGLPATSENRIEIANYPFGSNGENCGISLGMSAQSAFHSAGSLTVQNLGPILPINDRRGVFATFEKVIENDKIVFYFVTRNRNGMEFPYNQQDGQIVARYKLAEIDNVAGYAIAGNAQTAVANDGAICVIFAVNKIARNVQGQISAGSTSELKVAAIKPGEDININSLASSSYVVDNDSEGRTFNPSNVVVNSDASRLIATYTQTAIGGAQPFAYHEFDTNAQAIGDAVSGSEPTGFGAQSFPAQITLKTGHTVRANRISGAQISLSFNAPNLVAALNNTFDNLIDVALSQNIIPASNCSISLPQGSENTEILISALANSRIVINANEEPFRLDLSNFGIPTSQIVRYIREAHEDEILPQDYLARGAVVAVPNIAALTRNITDAPQSEIAPRFAVLDLPYNQKIIINGLPGMKLAVNATQYIISKTLPTPSSVVRPKASLMTPSLLQASPSSLPAASSVYHVDLSPSHRVSSSLSQTSESSSSLAEQSLYSDHFSDEFYSSLDFSSPSEILSSSQIQALLTPTPTQPSISTLDSLAYSVEAISSSLPPQASLSPVPDFISPQLTSSIYSILESSAPASNASEILSQANSQSQEIESLVTSGISSGSITSSQALSTLTQIISSVAPETQSMIESIGASSVAASLQMMTSSYWPTPTPTPTSLAPSVASYSSDIFSPIPTATPNPEPHDGASASGLDNVAIGGIVAAVAVSALFALYCCYKKVKQNSRISDSARNSITGGNEDSIATASSVNPLQETSFRLPPVRGGKPTNLPPLQFLQRSSTDLGWRSSSLDREGGSTIIKPESQIERASVQSLHSKKNKRDSSKA